MPAEDSKICPFCAETIKEKAIVCRYCGRDLPQENTDMVVENNKPNSQSHAKKRSWKWLIIAGVGLMALCFFQIICLSPTYNPFQTTITLTPTDTPTATVTNTPTVTKTPTITVTETKRPTKTLTPTKTVLYIDSSYLEIVQTATVLPEGFKEGQRSYYLDQFEGMYVVNWQGKVDTIYTAFKDHHTRHVIVKMDGGNTTYLIVERTVADQLSVGQVITFSGKVDLFSDIQIHTDGFIMTLEDEVEILEAPLPLE